MLARSVWVRPIAWASQRSARPSQHPRQPQHDRRDEARQAHPQHHPQEARAVLDPGQAAHVRAEDAGDECEWQEDRGDDRQQIKVAVGGFGEAGAQLFLQELGAFLDALEIVPDGGERLDRVAQQARLLGLEPARRVGGEAQDRVAADVELAADADDLDAHRSDVADGKGLVAHRDDLGQPVDVAAQEGDERGEVVGEAAEEGCDEGDGAAAVAPVQDLAPEGLHRLHRAWRPVMTSVRSQ